MGENCGKTVILVPRPGTFALDLELLTIDTKRKTPVTVPYVLLLG